MRECLSEDDTTMSLLSHTTSFSPVASQRIKENKEPFSQSSSRLERVEKLPSRAVDIVQEPHSRAAASAEEMTAKANWNKVYITPTVKPTDKQHQCGKEASLFEAPSDETDSIMS